MAILKLKPQDRQSIDFAEMLRKNGTMPINSLVFMTTSEQPGKMFGGDWICIASNVTLPLGDSAPVKGTGIAIGLTGPTGNSGLGTRAVGNYGVALTGMIDGYGQPVGTSVSSNVAASTGTKTYGLTADPTKSGIIADLANATSAISGLYVWKRIA